MVLPMTPMTPMFEEAFHGYGKNKVIINTTTAFPVTTNNK